MTAAITVPRKPGLGGWSISKAAVADACRELGVTEPVKIKWSQGRRRLGCHRYTAAAGHSITVTTYHATALGISETIWHELTHAMQLEKVKREQAAAGVTVDHRVFHAMYRRENASVGYRRNAFEVQARKIGSLMAGTRPLVVGALRAAVAPQPVAAPKPRPTTPVSGHEAYTGHYSVGTGHAVATERVSRVTGHRMQVIDGSKCDLGTVGGRWVLRDADTGKTQRFAGKRPAKYAMTAGL